MLTGLKGRQRPQRDTSGLGSSHSGRSFRGSRAVSKGNKTSLSLTFSLSLPVSLSWCGGHQPTPLPPLPHIWTWPSIYLALSAQPVCFPSEGKLKPVGFVFLLLFGRAPTFFFLFSSPGVSEPRVVFQKNTRWISGSQWGVGVGVRREGLSDETEHYVSPVWVLLFFVCLFKTGWTV